MKYKRLFISADMEGVAGVVTREQVIKDGFEYQKAREWMTNEVAAAAKSALSLGIEEVVVADAHYMAQNILIDNLPDNVELVRSWPRQLAMMDGIQRGKYDACMLIGYHTGAQSESGVMAHTIMGAFKDIRFNGSSASETMISAAVAGHFDIPVILVSGDDCYIDHAKDLLGNISTVQTKISTGYQSAQSRLPKSVCEEIALKTADAIGSINSVKPYKITNPITMEVEFKNANVVEILSYLKQVERIDAYTIKYEGETMIEISDFLTFLIHSVSGIQ